MAVRALDIYAPEILVPGGHKPSGRLTYNPATPIRKNCCIAFDGWGVVDDGGRPQGFRDITGNRDVYVSKNHVGNYEHWKPHKEGLHNRYGGVFADAETLWSDFTINAEFTFGAVFTLTLDTTFSLSRFIYSLVCDTTSGAGAGHGHFAANRLGITGTTTVTIEVSGGTYSFTVPELRDGKQHVAIARCANISGTSYAQLILDGVVYAEQSSVQTSTQQPVFVVAVPDNAHHNRGLDGIIKLAWYADYRAPVGQCVLESLNPWLTVRPQQPRWLARGFGAPPVGTTPFSPIAGPLHGRMRGPL